MLLCYSSGVFCSLSLYNKHCQAKELLRDDVENVYSRPIRRNSNNSAVHIPSSCFFFKRLNQLSHEILINGNIAHYTMIKTTTMYVHKKSKLGWTAASQTLTMMQWLLCPFEKSILGKLDLDIHIENEVWMHVVYTIHYVR